MEINECFFLTEYSLYGQGKSSLKWCGACDYQKEDGKQRCHAESQRLAPWKEVERNDI